jgi:hypothetical protein
MNPKIASAVGSSYGCDKAGAASRFRGLWARFLKQEERSRIYAAVERIKVRRRKVQIQWVIDFRER